MAFAHPGNTSADGCHYCRTNCDKWGVAWNQRHCHGAPAASAPTYTPPPVVIAKPEPIVVAEPIVTLEPTITTKFETTPAPIAQESLVEEKVEDDTPIKEAVPETSNDKPPKQNDSSGGGALVVLAGGGAYYWWKKRG